jgi:hypothetical protein
MAPPSLVEFILTFLARESVAAVSPRLKASVHLGTKGCLCDFTESIAEAREKVLNGFVCSYCRQAMIEDGLPELPGELRHVLDRSWLGTPLNPASPAGIAFNLGYDLFVTKGLKATHWESLRSTLRQEGIKQIGAVATAIVVAALLLVLGLT